MTTPSTDDARIVPGAESAEQIRVRGYELVPLDLLSLFVSSADADGRPLIYAGVCRNCGRSAYVVMPGDDDADSGYPALRAEHAADCFHWHIITVCPCANCTGVRGGPR